MKVFLSTEGQFSRRCRFTSPWNTWSYPLSRLKDQLVIVERQHLEVDERHRLDLHKTDSGIRPITSEAERSEQAMELSSLKLQIGQLEGEVKQATTQTKAERERLKASIRGQLDAIEAQVLTDLGDTLDLVRQPIQSETLPQDSGTLARLKDLIWKRQLRGLKDIANHALVVEQSAIAPLTMGIVHFKRCREIKEAMTTFVNDESKHSAIFQRFMAEKLDAKERVSQAIVKGGDRYLWLARIMPSGAIFLAVIVEAIGGAYLEFFGTEEHMPDPLFRSICKTIAERDERRHQDLCAETYNELYRRGTRWERFRNSYALKVTLTSAYGDKTEDHHLIQACRAFGIESAKPYRFIAAHLSAQLERIGMYVRPDELLAFMPVSASIRSSA